MHDMYCDHAVMASDRGSICAVGSRLFFMSRADAGRYFNNGEKTNFMTAVKKLDMTNNSVISCQVTVIARMRSDVFCGPKVTHRANGGN